MTEEYEYEYLFDCRFIDHTYGKNFSIEDSKIIAEYEGITMGKRAELTEKYGRITGYGPGTEQIKRTEGNLIAVIKNGKRAGETTREELVKRVKNPTIGYEGFKGFGFKEV